MATDTPPARLTAAELATIRERIEWHRVPETITALDLRRLLAHIATLEAELAAEQGPEMHTGEEWCVLLYPDMMIYDADGWRERGWHTQITQLTREEFEAAFAVSTIVSKAVTVPTQEVQP